MNICALNLMLLRGRRLEDKDTLGKEKDTGGIEKGMNVEEDHIVFEDRCPNLLMVSSAHGGVMKAAHQRGKNPYACLSNYGSACDEVES